MSKLKSFLVTTATVLVVINPIASKSHSPTHDVSRKSGNESICFDYRRRGY